jgi:hypothetical protein
MEPGAGNRQEFVDVNMTTIDDYLPLECHVDLVKIDVEGHEPFVIKGMEKTIARSSGIRIILEFFDHFLNITFGVDRFLEYIRSLGLYPCLIEADGKLRPLDSGETVVGEKYLFLTRTPAEDCARDFFEIPLYSLSFQNDRSDDNQFLYEPGKSGGVFSRLTTEAASHAPNEPLFWGPYWSLGPGDYEFSFLGELTGDMMIKLACNVGRKVLAEIPIADFRSPVRLENRELAEDFEIIAYPTESLSRVLLSGIQVRQRRI